METPIPGPEGAGRRSPVRQRVDLDIPAPASDYIPRQLPPGMRVSYFRLVVTPAFTSAASDIRLPLAFS